MGVDFFENAMKLLVIGVSAGGMWLAYSVIRVWIGKMERGAASSNDVRELRESVQRLTSELGELQERVDYAERLLTQQRQAGRIGG
jgi:hypothetical protein